MIHSIPLSADLSFYGQIGTARGLSNHGVLSNLRGPADRAMRLRIIHRTRYEYPAPVTENFNEVRIRPVSDLSQECHAFELVTDPVATLRRYHDLHLNSVDHFYVTEPHDHLLIEARSEVTTYGQATRLAAASFPLERIGECIRMERCYDYLQASEYVALDVSIWRLAQDAAQGQTDAWSAAKNLMGVIYREFTYDTTATTVHSRMIDVLQDRRGVCQDFAHVLIGMCRSLRIPARYVSGYLYVGEHAADLRGDLASHAWVEVFLPAHGWLPLDPTNNRLADEHHIKVAVGRDYADAAPVRGNFRGRPAEKMTVELKITPA